MNHWVCGATATSVKVAASATTSAGSMSVTRGASVIRQDGPKSSGGAGALNLPTPSGSGTAGGASSVRSTGGGAMQTAGAMVGVAVGAFAVFL
jgi:hypothetical protein